MINFGVTESHYIIWQLPLLSFYFTYAGSFKRGWINIEEATGTCYTESVGWTRSRINGGGGHDVFVDACLRRHDRVFIVTPAQG